MNRNRCVACIVAIMMLTLTGCKASPEKALTTKVVSPGENQVTVVTEPKISAGEAYKSSLETQRVFAVMLDNHSGARPQAGLKDAELVIEALAEGNITRYMAFFFGGMPQSVGPIRSARPYFIDRALEINAVYVHVGGSPKALSDIKTLKVNDLDGLSSSNKVFYRLKHKKMPHNQYSTMEILRNEAERRKFNLTPTTIEWLYADEDTSPSGDAALYVNLPYRKSDGGYYVSYSYDATNKYYARSINGKNHLDEIDQSQISAKNLIIQYVATKVVDDAGRLDLELVGSGEGYFLTDGVKIPITWNKESRKGRTVYKDVSGKEITLNPGNTWIQIVPKSMTIQWEK